MDRSRYRYYWDLWSVLVLTELKLRYNHTILGYFWSVANPLVSGLILFVAFDYALKVRVENFFLYLLSGLFPWQFFNNCMVQSSEVFLRNRNLLKKVIFPRFMLVLAMVGQNAIHFCMALPVFFLALLWYQPVGSLTALFYVPLLLINQGILVIGVSAAIGTLNLFFRDMQNLTTVLTNLWFYATPVIFKTSMLPDRLRWLFFLNPMTPVIELWHQALLTQTLDPGLLAYSFGLNLVILWFGMAVYHRWEARFAEVV